MAREKTKRNADQLRELFSQRGDYDDEGVLQGGLMAFIRHFWHVLEPATPLVEGWVLYAIVEHLEAVTFGEINRLLMNVPPGCSKSLITDVFWPAWEWSAMGMPHLRYVAFSYSSRLTERDNDRFTALMLSPEFQSLYAGQVQLHKTGNKKVANYQTGWKLATSVGGVGTGERGDRVILDDPHNVKEAESEIVREATVRWFREAMSNRLNDATRSAIVIIMQRVHEVDVSGTILEHGFDYVHLMIPMEFDADRQVVNGEPVTNVLGWSDPRFDPDDPEFGDGELAWPERWPEKVWTGMKAEFGPYAIASQYQQAPQARGGGVLRSEYWQLWDSPDGRFPPLEYVVASLDSAFTEKEENDPSALVVFGIFRNEAGAARAILLHAWRKRLRFHGPDQPRGPREPEPVYLRRVQPKWGLIEWTAYSCRRFKVDRLIIEGKASGISAAQELQRLHGDEGWSIETVSPQGDKFARAVAVQPSFSQGLVYAPDREWAQMVIDEAAAFPRGRYKDLTDATTQAIKHLRDYGLLKFDIEIAVETRAKTSLRKQSAPLYPV